jgi:ribosome-associated protein
VADPLVIDDRRTIPGDELEVTTARSGGPGGQHVNTTDSRVRLRWRLSGSAVLAPEVVARLVDQRRTWVTRDGDLVITCDEHRSQHMNLEIARERLVEAVKQALVAPRPRKKTAPSRGAKERRLTEKKVRKGVKAGRGRVGDE